MTCSGKKIVIFNREAQSIKARCTSVLRSTKLLESHCGNLRSLDAPKFEGRMCLYVIYHLPFGVRTTTVKLLLQLFTCAVAGRDDQQAAVSQHCPHRCLVPLSGVRAARQPNRIQGALVRHDMEPWACLAIHQVCHLQLHVGQAVAVQHSPGQLHRRFAVVIPCQPREPLSCEADQHGAIAGSNIQKRYLVVFQLVVMFPDEVRGPSNDTIQGVAPKPHLALIA
mmetsp:Transcript_11917/g.35688  ORF Transcript_11917/g.35688 Transcript_11917/m.35688 type:complete len:224 (+) Transcript_11917:93-764(+)